MVSENIHSNLTEKYEKLNQWFNSKREALPTPIYTSVDVRDAGFKVAPVDANIFPAGFNNICEVDREEAPKIAKKYLNANYGPDVSKILILTEEHTNNPYYWENIKELSKIISSAGYDIRLAMPKEMETIEVETASGVVLKVFGASRLEGSVQLEDGFKPDLIISNNDFSIDYKDWANELLVPLNPARELGWYQRSKYIHFKKYNEIATEFANLLGQDPFKFTVETEIFENFDVSSDESKKKLAKIADDMLARIKKNYEERNIKAEPVVFIKNDSGTYGLAVNHVKSGDEVLAWNYKAKKKMKAAKGGRKVENVIIQEGIPSTIKFEDSTAEPVIYLVGCSLIGGFLRTHKEKGESESLNSPGAVYKRLCMSDLKVDRSEHPLENVYGFIAKLSSLAVAMEAEELTKSLD